jgi:hypothetical protein
LSFFSSDLGGSDDDADPADEEAVGVGVENGERLELVDKEDAESAFALTVVDTEDDVAEEDSEVVVCTPIIVTVEGVPETRQLRRITEKGFGTY